MSTERSWNQAMGKRGHHSWKNLHLPESKGKVRKVCFIDGVMLRPDEPLRKSLCQSGVTEETHQSAHSEERMVERGWQLG